MASRYIWQSKFVDVFGADTIGLGDIRPDLDGTLRVRAFWKIISGALLVERWGLSGRAYGEVEPRCFSMDRHTDAWV